MTREELLEFTRERPFRAFEIRMVSGERCVVKTPEVIVSETSMAILDNGGIRHVVNEAVESVKWVSRGRPKAKRG